MMRRIAALFLIFVLIPFPLMAQAGSQGRGALRPFFYVFLAYGLVWVAIGFWVYLIARRLGRLERDLQAQPSSTSGP